MRKLLSWWPGIVAYLWLHVVYEIAGLRASYLVAGSMLAVALVGIWEGRRKPPPDPIDEHPQAGVG